MDNDRPIVFTITQNDAEHYSIYTRDSRTDIVANVGYEGLFDMLVSISEEFKKQGYAAVFEVN